MKFEYIVETWEGIEPGVTEALQNRMNELGASGWELHSITPQITSDYSISDGPEHIRSCDSVSVYCNIVVIKKAVG